MPQPPYGPPPLYEPSPQEIDRMTAEIRAGWSPEERQRRLRADWLPQRWEVPTAACGERTVRERWDLLPES